MLNKDDKMHLKITKWMVETPGDPEPFKYWFISEGKALAFFHKQQPTLDPYTGRTIAWAGAQLYEVTFKCREYK